MRGERKLALEARIRLRRVTIAIAYKKPKVRPIGEPVDVLRTGLPCNLDAERFLLGSVLLDDERFPEIAALTPEDFSLERHKQIFRRMLDLRARDEHIDRLTVVHELLYCNELEHVSLSYLASLDDNLPRILHLDTWVQIVLDKSTLRHLILSAQKLMNECLLGVAPPNEILFGHIAGIEELGRRGVRAGQMIADIPLIRDCSNPAIEFLHNPELVRGTVTGFTGDSGSGKSTLASSIAGAVSEAGIPVLILDRENPIAAVAERLGRLGVTDGPKLKYWGGWSGAAVPQPGDPAIVNWVKACEPRPLVIVDSFVAFHGGDENDAGETRAFMQQCRKLADLGATVVVIHHDGKSETAKDYRGSSDFKAAIDQGFHISNYGVEGRLGSVRLRCYKSRFGFAGELLYCYMEGRFIKDQSANAPLRTVTEQLRELLKANPGTTTTEFEIMAGGHSLSRSRIRQFIADGVCSGIIRMEKGHRNIRRLYLVTS